MKNLLFGVLVIVSFQAFGQHTVDIGIQVGTGAGDFRGDGIAEEASSKISPLFGAFIEKKLATTNFIRAHVQYGEKKISFRDFVITTSDPGSPRPLSTFKTSVTAASISFLGGYKSEGSLQFLVAVGPYFAYHTKFQNIVATNVDYGLHGTIGLAYNLGAMGALRAELSDELGLANINNFNVIDDPAIRTNRIAASIAYVIRL